MVGTDEAATSPANAPLDGERVDQLPELTDPPGTKPETSEVFRSFNPEQHKAVTRRTIAIIILSILAALYGVGAVAFVAHDLSSDDFVRLIAAFSGIQTLAAAAVGFYFAKGE